MVSTPAQRRGTSALGPVASERRRQHFHPRLQYTRAGPRWLPTFALFVIVARGLAAEADVSGLWKFTFTNPQGPTISVRATLDQRGNKITGSIDLPAGTVDIDGGWNGAELTLSFRYPDFESGAAITATLIGKLVGADLKGAIDYETFGSGEWTGTRDEGKRQSAPQAAQSPAPMFPAVY